MAQVSLVKLSTHESHWTLLIISQAKSHYLSQCWPKPTSPCGVTAPKIYSTFIFLFMVWHYIIEIRIIELSWMTPFCYQTKIESCILCKVISLRHVVIKFRIKHIHCSLSVASSAYSSLIYCFELSLKNTLTVLENRSTFNPSKILIVTGLGHYDDVIMTTLASQITSLTVVYSTVYSGADQSKHQSSASLAFVRGIHRDRWIPRTKGQ